MGSIADLGNHRRIDIFPLVNAAIYFIEIQSSSSLQLPKDSITIIIFGQD